MFPAIEDKEKEEKVFFASYILWMTAGVLKLTLFHNMEVIDVLCEYMQKLAYLLLIVLFFMRRRDKVRDFLGIGLIVICCILARHSVYSLHIFAVAVYAYFALDIDFRKILKCTVILQMVLMAVVILSSQVGILENVAWMRGDVVRYGLGYNYCAYPAHFLLFITLMWFCLRKKTRVLEMAVAIALNYGMYVLTDSRADFYLAVLGVIGIVIWQQDYRQKWVNAIRSFAVKWGFVIAAVFSLLIQAFYNADNAVMAAANRVLSDRLNLGHKALSTYGLTLFGQKIEWIGQSSVQEDPSAVYNYVDNAFLKEGISYGILFLILLAIGFYFMGKYLLAHKEYKLTWAVLIAIAYGMVNAHLCVLVYDVFILLLGCCLKRKEWEETSIKDWLSLHLDDRRKGILRSGLMLGILFIVTYVQCQGTSYMALNARVWTWVVAGLLLLIACLCWEKDLNETRLLGSGFGKLLFVFLILLCISDFFVSKRFLYAGFAMLACGGFFCKCWSSMQDPDQIFTEFKLVFKLWFVVGVLYCIICRPTISGICYSGMYPDAESFGLSMLIAAVIFLSDMRKEHREIVNSAGMVCALYLLWLSKQTIILLAACFILILYAAFWIYTWATSAQENRFRILGHMAIGLAAGAVFVFLLRGIFPRLALALGTQVVYENDKSQAIGVTLLQLGSIEGWRELFQTKWTYCVEYVKNLNLLGHKYLLEIDGKEHWAPNGILMIGYRYGVLAGLCYIGVLVWYLVRAVKQSLKAKEFLLAGIAASLVIVGMMVTIERSFVCMAWIVLWFGVCGISFSALKEQALKE